MTLQSLYELSRSRKRGIHPTIPEINYSSQDSYVVIPNIVCLSPTGVFQAAYTYSRIHVNLPADLQIHKPFNST
jgi:hypothetical protein